MFINNFSSDIFIIARPKLNGIGEHWGVHLPNGWVAHNTDDKGPLYVTLQEFQAGKSIKVIRKVPPTEYNSTLMRIQQEINNPQSYHLSANNCDVFANRVTGYVPESPQVKNWVFFFALIGIVVLATKAA